MNFPSEDVGIVKHPHKSDGLVGNRGASLLMNGTCEHSCAKRQLSSQGAGPDLIEMEFWR